MSRPTSLRTRILLTTVGVAAATVIVTGAVMVPTVRAATLSGARSQLAAQVELLATAGVDALNAARAADSHAQFAVVRDGAARGPAAPFASEAVLDALARSGSFSGTVRTAGPALVEARTSGTGVGVIGALPVRTVERAQWLATGPILLALAAGLVFAVLAGLLLAQWLTHSLRATAQSARRLARGERGVTVPASGATDIREVATALTALDSALAGSESRQREFLLSVSHELRTPLSAIRGYGEALKDGLISGAATQDAGRVMVAETERLELFVGDLLALARLEADDFRLEVAEVDVSAVVREAAEGWEGRAVLLDIRLTTVLPDAAVLVRSDARRVRQVLDGLIENALRATPAGGAVTVRAGAEQRGALIEVADTGAGLSDDDLAVAFERGALHERYRAVRPVGTGLGLSIAKRLVERLGGTILARSVDGTGTVFEVRIADS